jgi:hypothetical protein
MPRHDYWRVGYTEETAWGKMVDLVDRYTRRVCRVDCPDGDESRMKLIQDAPRMNVCIRDLDEALESYGSSIGELFGDDIMMMNAIREVRLLAARHRKKVTG